MTKRFDTCFLGIRWLEHLYPEGYEWIKQALRQSPEWKEPYEVYKFGIVDLKRTEEHLDIRCPVWNPTPDRLDGPIEDMKLHIPLSGLPVEFRTGFEKLHRDWEAELKKHEDFQEALAEQGFGSELHSAGCLILFVDAMFDPGEFYIQGRFFVDPEDVDAEQWKSEEIMQVIIDHDANPLSVSMGDNDENTWIPKTLFHQDHAGLLKQLVRWRELLNPPSILEADTLGLKEFYGEYD
jgi:hypothetical protein